MNSNECNPFASVRIRSNSLLGHAKTKSSHVCTALAESFVLYLSRVSLLREKNKSKIFKTTKSKQMFVECLGREERKCIYIYMLWTDWERSVPSSLGMVKQWIRTNANGCERIANGVHTWGLLFLVWSSNDFERMQSVRIRSHSSEFIAWPCQH